MFNISVATLLIAILLVLIVQFKFNTKNATAIRQELEEAQEYCMQWRMPAQVVNGETYCVNSVLYSFPDGTTIFAQQLWNKTEMEEIFDTFLKSEQFR